MQVYKDMGWQFTILPEASTLVTVIQIHIQMISTDCLYTLKFFNLKSGTSNPYLELLQKQSWFTILR